MMKNQAFTFLNFILFFILLTYGQEYLSSDIFVNIYDKNKIPLENVYIQLTYLEFVNQTLVTKTIAGLTDQNGQWIGKLELDFNSTPSNYLFLYYYHPHTSGTKTLHFNPYSKSSFYDIELPLEVFVHRIGVFQSNRPVFGAHVWFLRPYVHYSQTDKNGYSVVRFPSDTKVEGFIIYQNHSTFFDFFSNESTNIKINYPFFYPLKINFSNSVFNITKIYLSTSDKKPFAYKPIIISFNDLGFNSTYITDSFGVVYLPFSPTNNLTIFYFYGDQILSSSFEISNSSQNFKLNIPKLLTIGSPTITYIGESCYNVQVEISEPRRGIVQKVYAKALESNDTYILTIEQKQVLNKTKLFFYKIFCVLNDTYFDIFAQSPYENTSIRIQLLKPEEEPKLVLENIKEDPIPSSLKRKLQEAQRTELIILLLELALILFIIFLFLKFKKYVFFVFQSIIQFFYFYFKKKK